MAIRVYKKSQTSINKKPSKINFSLSKLWIKWTSARTAWTKIQTVLKKFGIKLSNYKIFKLGLKSLTTGQKIFIVFFNLLKAVFFKIITLLAAIWKKIPRSWKVKLAKTGFKLKKTRAGQLLLKILFVFASSPPLLFYKKYRKKVLTVITIVLFMLVILSVYKSQQAKPSEAAWFNDGWMHRKPITITNGGSVQTDFQVLVTVDTASLISSGKMQSDCDDVRFTNNNGKLLPHLQSTACDAAETRYWVKVDSIPTSTSTLYLYYGNSSVNSTSNRDATIDISYLGTFSQLFSDANIAMNHGASSDRDTNFYISQSTYVNRFNSSWVYQQQYAGLDLYTGLCYDDKNDRFYGIDWTNKQWSTFTTSFTETSPMDQSVGNQPIDCGTDSTYVYTNHRNGLIQRNQISDNASSSINMDTLTGFDWGGQGLTYAFGYLFAGTSGSYGDNGNRIYVIDISDWSNPQIVTFWDASGHTLADVSGLTWKGKYIYQTSRSEDNASEWQGPVKVAATEPTVSSPGTEEVSPGPAGYWNFDEGYGTTAYDTAGGTTDNGTITGGGHWQSEDMCVSGKCLYFAGDASNDYVSTGTGSDVTHTGAMTVSAWVRANTAATTRG